MTQIQGDKLNDGGGVGAMPSSKARAAAATQSSEQAVSSKADIAIAGPERITVSEFHARLKAQGVPNQNHAALVCPVCETVQSMASLVAAGATPEEAERCIGFSCEGRLTGAGPWSSKSAKRRAVRGCDWSLGGLFRIHGLEVLTDDGVAHPRFVVASPEQAQALARRIEAGTDETPQAAQPEGREPDPKGRAQ